MNNNTPAILRSLIVYAICIPLAIFVGYLLASESQVSQTGNSIWAWNVLGLFQSNPIAWSTIALVMVSPLLLRWHHPLLVLSWNFGLIVFFMPGTPNVWLPMICLSLGISVLHRALNSEARFISAPEITWPLLFLMAVVFVTAKLTGGIGLKSMGSDVMGGKRYVFLLVGILGYFALTAKRIPPEKAGLYVCLFFIGSCTNVIGDLAAVVPPSLYFIFQFFPASGYLTSSSPGDDERSMRLGGVGIMGVGMFSLMMARYGIRGIFLSGKPWRLLVFALFSVSILFGGFRSFIILCALMFFIQFFIERLQRTVLFPIFIFIGIIGVVLVIPFANKLPYTFQRSLAFLPLNINPVARMDAEGSSSWRYAMWKEVYPQVPHYLLLGKGFALSQSDMQIMSTKGFRDISDAEGSIGIAGNFHSGPLSVVLPFGIWGVIAMVWFWIAAVRALYQNYRNGDPALRTINTFLFAYFIARIFEFLFIFGGLYTDMQIFTGIIGFSIALNDGIRRKSPLPVSEMKQAIGPSHSFRPRFATARFETQTPHR